MRQDKDRAGKWLLARHGDSLLRLAGITGFASWAAVTPETVAPRRLPDGLLEVRFPGEPDAVLVLVEVETYPDADADRQVLDDLMLIAVDRKAIPEVVVLVLRPKGNLTVVGQGERASRSGRVRLGATWPVVRLWELEAEALLATGDPGLLPLALLAHSTEPPEELVMRVRDRVAGLPPALDRAGMMAVTDILSQLAFPGRDFRDFFRGRPMLQGVILEMMRLNPKLVREVLENEERRDVIRTVLDARFGSIDPDRLAGLDSVCEPDELRQLARLAATCPDVDTFVAALPPPTPDPFA